MAPKQPNGRWSCKSPCVPDSIAYNKHNSIQGFGEYIPGRGCYSFNHPPTQGQNRAIPAPQSLEYSGRNASSKTRGRKKASPPFTEEEPRSCCPQRLIVYPNPLRTLLNVPECCPFLLAAPSSFASTALKQAQNIAVPEMIVGLIGVIASVGFHQLTMGTLGLGACGAGLALSMTGILMLGVFIAAIWLFK